MTRPLIFYLHTHSLPSLLRQRVGLLPLLYVSSGSRASMMGGCGPAIAAVMSAGQSVACSMGKSAMVLSPLL
jgi:hypothetical protein